MRKEEKCSLCNELAKIKYLPMDEWKIDGKNFRILSWKAC